MAEEEEDGITTRDAKYLAETEIALLKVVLEGVTKSQREFEEIEQKTAAPRMDIFPRYGGWVNGSIFEVVQERKWDYKEMIKKLEKIISVQEKSSTVCEENEELNRRERGIIFENERPDQVKEEFLENLQQVLVVIREFKENLLKYVRQFVKMIVNMVRKMKGEEAAEEETETEEHDERSFDLKMFTFDWDSTKLDKASRKVEMIKFPEVEGDEDLDKEWKKLEQTEDRAVNLGINLTRNLVEFSLLGVEYWTQTVKQFELRKWIECQSFKRNNEVPIRMSFILYRTEEIARDMEVIKTDDLTIAFEGYIWEDDGPSEGEKIKDDLLVNFVKAICGLQSIVSYLQRKLGIPQKNELSVLDRLFNLCDDNLKRAVLVMNDLKQRLRWETSYTFKKKMNAEIDQHWIKSRLGFKTAGKSEQKQMAENVSKRKRSKKGKGR